MRKRYTAIGKRLIKVSIGDQFPMVWKRRQWMTVPVQPTQQLLFNAKTRTKTVEQALGCRERKFPTMLRTLPEPSRTDPADLRMGHRIEGIADPHQA